MPGPPWTDIESLRLKSGQISALTIDNIPVTFPSNRFCTRQVDDNFLNHVVEVIKSGHTNYGNGAVEAGLYKNCGHKKLTGGNAIAYKWDPSGTTLRIVGYGEKSAGGRKVKNSGNYS